MYHLVSPIVILFIIPQTLHIVKTLTLIENKEINVIPALLNIFNEILVNARDQIVRLNQMYEKDKVSKHEP